MRCFYNSKNAWYVVPSSFGLVVKKTCGVTNKIFFVFYNFLNFNTTTSTTITFAIIKRQFFGNGT